MWTIVERLPRSIPLLLLAGLISGTVALASTREEAKKLAVRSYLQLVAAPDQEGRDTLFPETVLFNGVTVPSRFLQELVGSIRGSFPDLRFRILGQMAQADHVATWGFFEGTHRGEFAGIPPSGQGVRWLGVPIDRLERGKVVELWHEMDTWGLVKQLQLEPGPSK